MAMGEHTVDTSSHGSDRGPLPSDVKSIFLGNIPDSAIRPLFEKKLSELRVVYVCATGIGSRLSEYLAPRARTLAVIYPVHPPNYDGGPVIRCFLWHGGLLSKHVDLGGRLSPVLRGLSLLHHSLVQLPSMLFGLFWILTLRNRFDIFIGLESVFGFWGLLLKRMGVAKRVVVWSFDHFTDTGRGGVNSVFVRTWRTLDKLVQNRSDMIWYASREVMRAKEREGVLQSGAVLRLLVPSGVDATYLSKTGATVDRKRLVYCGRLEDDVALELVLDVLKSITEHDPSVKLTIIGTGSKQSRLKQKAQELGLEEHVEFMGFVREEERVREILAGSGIGLAPYVISPESSMHYAAPSKVKLYMEAGIPIVMTRISAIAREIEERHAGLVVNCDQAEMQRALEKLLGERDLWLEVKTNVVAMAKEHDYRSIFDSAFSMVTRR